MDAERFELYLIRHGLAAERGENYPDDTKRPLTSEGMQKLRKEAKAHGSKRMLEGSSHLPKGARVAILEDVITTGGSTLRAAEQLREHGFEVAGVVAVVDRREGGADAIRDAGLALVALFGREDFP